MGFENTVLVAVTKLNHASVLNRRSEQLIDLRVDMNISGDVTYIRQIAPVD